MVAQSELGLLLRDHYRDAAWIETTWLGNDWVTLVVVVPLLVLSFELAARGSIRGLLLLAGVFAYAFYNYSYYLLGAALNVFFPLYVCAVLTSAAGLIAFGARIDPRAVAARFRPDAPAHLAGIYFVSVGLALAVVWLMFWAHHVFLGQPTPIEPEAFKLVAALDTVLIVPALVIGGTLLLRRHPWGYVMACAAGVQASLYLIVLFTNAFLFVRLGPADWPGELEIWGPLAASAITVTVWLFSNASQPGEV